jgi:ribosome-associated heat shock protein Hsp15
MRRPERAADEAGASAPRVRLDKWLWAARFYKTRGLAAEAIDAGHVKVGGERVKPSRPLKAGDRVSIARGGLVREVDVLALAERRGTAVEAQRLYAETAESASAREAENARRRGDALPNAGRERPTKRSRRRLDEFLSKP